jgi:hypothetical protein
MSEWERTDVEQLCIDNILSKWTSLNQFLAAINDAV